MKRLAIVATLGLLVAMPLSARGDISQIRQLDKSTLTRYDNTSVASTGLTLQAIGDPIPGGSWFMDFGVSTTTTFNSLGIGLTKAGGGSYSGLSNDGIDAMDFGVGGTAGWAQTAFIPTPLATTGYIATAAGPSGLGLNWRTHFVDPMSEPFTLTAFAYDAGTEVFDSATATWNGSSWSYNDDVGMSWETFVGGIAGVPAAPVPAAALLASIGLMSFGIVRRRFS